MTKESPNSKSLRTKRAHSKRSKELTTAVELLLQPWFLTRPVAFAIQNLIPQDFRFKMRDFFVDWGCLRCGRRNVLYGTNGLCIGCIRTVYYRLLSTAKRRAKLKQQLHYGKEFVAQADRARKLVEGLSRKGPKSSQVTKIATVQVGSPAIHALDRFEG